MPSNLHCYKMDDIVIHNLLNVYQYQCLGLHNQEVHKKHHRVFHVNVKLLIRKNGFSPNQIC